MQGGVQAVGMETRYVAFRSQKVLPPRRIAFPGSRLAATFPQRAVSGLVCTRTFASSALPEGTEILLDQGSGFKKTVLLDNDGLDLVLRNKRAGGLEDVETGQVVSDIRLLKRDGRYKIEGLMEKPKPIIVQIDKNDGVGPVPQTFLNDNNFHSYLSRAGVARLEVVGSEMVERTSEFSELDPSKTYRWPADPESSEDLRRQIKNQNRAFQQPVLEKLMRHLQIRGIDLLPAQFDYHLTDDKPSKGGQANFDVDILLRSEDGMQHFLVEAKRWAGQDVICCQINAILAYQKLEELPAGATVQGVVAAQGWARGVRKAAWNEGWWVVVDAGGTLDVLESPPAKSGCDEVSDEA